MPDIFTAEELATRDRRFIDENPSELAVPVTQEAVQQAIASKEPPPPIENHSATPRHPERHVGTNSMHIFSAYCEKPDNVTFEIQEEDEEILLLVRKSFITNIPWLFFGFLFTFLPLVFVFFIHPENTPFALLPASYVLVLLTFYYLVVGSYMFVSFITWYFNTSLITTKRIVDIDFQDLVYKNIAETKMDLIQDVSFTQTGVLRTLFNFGDVLVQTAGSLENFDLTAIPHPDRTVDIVEALIGKARDVGV